MNWFDVLKEQRQVARTTQSFRPIQLDKPIKLNKPKNNCEEQFMERVKDYLKNLGFNSPNIRFPKGPESNEINIYNTSGPEYIAYFKYNGNIPDELFCLALQQIEETPFPAETEAYHSREIEETNKTYGDFEIIVEKEYTSLLIKIKNKQDKTNFCSVSIWKDYVNFGKMFTKEEERNF